jgi:arylsulfatase A-like enzyme
MTSAEKSWWQDNGQALVNTMCFAGSADVVGLLADKTSYGVFGDHGGAQKDVQRIPMVMYAKGITHQVRDKRARLVDITPTILKAMGIRQLAPMDGSAIGLPL